MRPAIHPCWGETDRLSALRVDMVPSGDPGLPGSSESSNCRSRWRPWILISCVIVTSVLAAQMVDTAADGSAPTTSQFSSAGEIAAQRTAQVPALRQVSGLLAAPGGPYLRDRFGRIITLHGVNAVDKEAPYELYPSPGRRWNFSRGDARRIASLGFNVVRLGILWQGIDPGLGGINDPQTCAEGRPRTGPPVTTATNVTYLRHIRATVELLGSFHIYTILDMHQDVYGAAFRGEGAPNWAVCTNGDPIVPIAGRWSKNYVSLTLKVAETHFWLNNVVGNLQGSYGQAWAEVAHYFKNVPWLLGYDPYNEPYSAALTAADDEHFAVDLECFYTGTAHPGTLDGDGAPTHCPPDDPRIGVIPTILNADPRHLIFIEPDNFSIRHQLPSLLGRMSFPNLVYNFHAYCGDRSPITGDPTDVAACVDQIRHNIVTRQGDLRSMSTRFQPGGPAWLMSEFGASEDRMLLSGVDTAAGTLGLGWIYWSWKYYGDPTGSSHESLVRADGVLKSSVGALDSTYAEAISGRPEETSFDPFDGVFQLQFAPNHRIRAPTVVVLSPATDFPHGYCTKVTDGTIVSPAGARHLAIVPRTASPQVTVEVSAGPCP